MTPPDAPYKLRQRELDRLAWLAKLPVPTFYIPKPTHRGSFVAIEESRRG